MVMGDRRYWALILTSVMLAACDQASRVDANVAETPTTSTAATAPVADVPAADTSTADAPVRADGAAADASPAAEASPDAQAQAGSASLRASFAKCAESSGGVDVAMQDCIASEYGYHDNRLNAAYAELKQSLPAEKMTSLRAAQRQWLIERDSKCSWDAKTEGSAQRLQANYCRMEATAARADALEAMR